MKNLHQILEKYRHLEIPCDIFVSAVGEITELGNIRAIKKQVGEEVFTFYVGVHMIGIWQSDGWGSLFAESSKFLPYISNTLKNLHLTELKEVFDKLFGELNHYFENIEVPFLKEMDGEISADYDVVNFLLNPRFKIENEKLNRIDTAERKRISQVYGEGITALDDISEKLWGYNAEEEGWKNIIDYIEPIS